MKKSAIAIFAAALLMLSVVSMFYTTGIVIASPGDDYATIMGVLASDYFSLYPYEAQSLDFGISKYGELIDGEGLLPDVGLQYPGYETAGTHDQRVDARDPFANEGIDKMLWLNGWLLEARYTHRTYGDQRVLTMAMSADMAVYGGDWLNGHDPNFALAPHGGRKTTGYAETEDLEVLYDGPRKYIAICKTTIYDWYDSDEDETVDHPDETWPILDFRLTFIFNKVKKEVIILKDLKILISGKALTSPLDIQLSNREEWDLGPEPDWASYAHFFTDLDTCYGDEEDSKVHLAEGLMREFIYRDSGANTPDGTEVCIDGSGYVRPVVEGSVRVYIDYDDDDPDMGLVWLTPGDDYDIDMDTGEIDWHISVADDDDVEVIYKLWEGSEAGGIPHNYDVAQIISEDEEYVGFKAFWPSLSDYTVDGWTVSFIPLINVSDADMGIEPEIPFTIGEWDFMLGKGHPEQFRGVEVVGLTDYHDADDADLGETDILDREVCYQLDEVFWPWDLLSAVHKKDTSRWVEFFEYDEDFGFEGDWPYVELEYYVTRRGPWDAYCSFAERVLVDGVLITPLDAIIGDPDDENFASYPYTYEVTGDWLWFYEWDEDDEEWDPWEMDDGAMVKVLYSTDEYYETGYPDAGAWQPGRYEWVEVGRDAASVDSVGAALVTAAFKQKWFDIGIGGEDMMDTALANQIPYIMAMMDEGYEDDLGRTALKDDWCTYWPVASSNIIGVGGPIANVLSYYGNDFTDAFYGMPEYAPSESYSGMITGITCWNRGWDGTWNVYESSEDTGYAVISTYKDINGTVLFLVWGHWGRDTFYASQWLHGDVARDIVPGIVQLQSAPACLTSIILEIDYDDPEHPEFSIVEALGTITEFDWTHTYYDVLQEDDVEEDKGGLHDP